MTVYLIQEPRPFLNHRTGKDTTRDVSSAAQYGVLRHLLGADDQPTNMPGPCLNKIKSGLAGFDAEQDYILFAGGDPLGALLTGLALRDHPFPTVQFLRWDRVRDKSGQRNGTGVYTPITVNIR